MELSGYAFGRVCDIEPDRTDAGAVEIAVPQPEYANRDEKAVHDHGWGPFCTFGVPDEGTHRPGVYAIAVEDEVAYVGETQDCYAKFANGYGNISPADCFTGGGGTNCRLNTAIFHAVRAGDRVSLHLHATEDFAGSDEENRALRRIIKDDLVTALDPAWNRTGGDADRAGDAESGANDEESLDGENVDEEPLRGESVEPKPAESESTESDVPARGEFDRGPFEPISTDTNRFEAEGFETKPVEPERAEARSEPPVDRAPEWREDDETDGTDGRSGADPASDRPTGGFAPLYDYLADHERDRIERSFDELEVVLEADLPMEARRWRRWWTNDEASHPHSGAWLRAGYEVTAVSLPEGRVVFERVSTDGRAAGSVESEFESPPQGRVAPRRRE